MLLVVDDNKSAAHALQALLRKDGYRVSVAYDGESAISLAKRTNPDAIILDIDLPGRNGFEVARELKYRLNSAALVIALTGCFGRREDREASRAAGFDYHLIKPVLASEIEEILNSPERKVARGLLW